MSSVLLHGMEGRFHYLYEPLRPELGQRVARKGTELGRKAVEVVRRTSNCEIGQSFFSMEYICKVSRPVPPY